MRLSLSLALALALIAGSTAVADPPKTTKKVNGKSTAVNKAVVATDLTLIAELQRAHYVLDKADPIYSGHRVHAMKEINHAIGHLQSEIKAKGMKIPHVEDGVTLPTAVSHALVVKSAQQLAVVLKQLHGLPKSPSRNKASGHLKNAIVEMEKGLVAAKMNGK